MPALHSFSRIKCILSTELKPGPQLVPREWAVIIHGVSAAISIHFVSSKLPAERWAQGGSSCISLSHLCISGAKTAPGKNLALGKCCWVELKTYSSSLFCGTFSNPLNILFCLRLAKCPWARQGR